VGIARTLKTQEITFMYKKQPFKRRQQKIYAIISNKNKLLNHAFRNKTKQKNKVQGSLEHYDSRHFIRLPPHLGETLSSMIQNKREIKRNEKKRKKKE